MSPAAEFLQDEWGRGSLAGWLHHKFGIAGNPADWAGLAKDEVIKRIQAVVRQLYAQKEAEFPVRVGLTRYLQERTHTQGPRYDREGLAAWASQRFHTVIDPEELQPLLRPEIEALLLKVARDHYQGARLAEELDRRFEAAFGPTPPGVICRPTPRRLPSWSTGLARSLVWKRRGTSWPGSRDKTRRSVPWTPRRCPASLRNA